MKTGYITRGANIALKWCQTKLYKCDGTWTNNGRCIYISDFYNFKVYLEFIKWEDSKPWVVKYLLKLEVKHEE